MKKTASAILMIILFVAVSCDKEILPVVKTLSFNVINLDSVMLTGEVVHENPGEITGRGFYWGSGASPGINDNVTVNQSGTGEFTQLITKLTLGQKYYFRSYAVTSSGTFLGPVLRMKVEINPMFGKMIDPRDGRTYSTVTIRSQTWMAENLDYLPAVSRSWNGSETLPHYYVYDYEGTEIFVANNTENYETYGVLYNWPAAGTACPPNWHLPSDEEWTLLTNFLAGSAGGLMKETGTDHWLSPNTGASNLSGFNALPAGYRRYDFGFYSAGTDAYFWSASENDQYSSLIRYMYNSSGSVFRYNSNKSSGFSVRCILNPLQPESITTGKTKKRNEGGQTK